MTWKTRTKLKRAFSFSRKHRHKYKPPANFQEYHRDIICWELQNDIMSFRRRKVPVPKNLLLTARAAGAIKDLKFTKRRYSFNLVPPF